MAMRATVSRFPADDKTLEASGLPWGVTVTPFAPADERGDTPLYGSGGHLLPRCENCWGYLSALCEIERWGWTCALCGSFIGLDSATLDRYTQPQECPELSSSFIDLELPAEGSGDGEMQTRPVYVAAVDLSSSEEFLELVKSALLAALEALVPGSLFGLVTFSHKIGLYDVQGPIAVVKNIFIPPDLEDRLPVDLEDVMPLLSFLAPVETCKDRIAAALETLKPTTSWERTTAAGQGHNDGVLLGGRGFGVAMTALIDYLSSEYGSTFALARVFAFMSGPPDYGSGQLDTRRYGEQYASKREDADLALLSEQTPFYKDLAAVAVQAGVCVDIFAITDEYTDLASLKYLSIESGGSLFLYSNMDDSTLPQDMYRMLSRPYAFGCILRLRTSSDFKLGYSYGHFFPDPQYENVQHIIYCDSFATYAYDFEFANSNGFFRYTEPPVLQLAFQYSIVVPQEDTDTSESNSARSSKFCVKRRLRIRTLQYSSASNMNELYDSVDPEATLSILVHKVILASLKEGVREGRLLLHDWLVILTAQYNDAHGLVQSGAVNETSRVDVAFSQCPQLQSMPRLIFALLRNPLLRLHEEGIHPDFRIYLQCLFSALEPISLQLAIYPLLASYSTPDNLAYPRHSLSRAALLTSGSPIFLLDAFTNLIVYYSPSADLSLPFPPPHDCLLRTTINKLKQERCITPKLTFIRGAEDDASVFERYLIEEQNVDGFSSLMGFDSFLEEISQGVVEFLK
ncbi:protein transport protein sec24-like [Zingiber officinale]|uniref:protein transport protein sec24-like n=1 Tax=Zingiber officinale TaxID=94328 RepID=UPI001C4A9A62|nr:protein transport protein sec24-like [Zingiber officinale]